MKVEKSVRGSVLTVTITLPKNPRGNPLQKITTSNVINLPELSKYNILSVISQDVIVSSENSEVIGEWTFKLKKQSKPKRVSRKVAKKVE